jgi:response regulator RpfG family c-di-GMP phosphodiesterase
METDRERTNILLVEDRCSHVSVVRNALEAANTRCRLQTVGASSNTMNYLRKRDPYCEAPTPDLVLFNLSDILPESMRLLEQIKADNETAKIPVVLLIDAESEDVLQQLLGERHDRTLFSPIALDSFLLAMNPFRLDRFLNAVKLIGSLGFVLVTLPAAQQVACPGSEGSSR